MSENAFGCWQFFLGLITDEVQTWRRVDECLRAQVGISLVSLEALYLIDGIGRHRLDRLAEHLSTTTVSLRSIIDELQQIGWCRVSSLTDVSTAEVELTPSGHQVVIRSRALVRAELAEELRRSLSAGPSGHAAW